MANITSADVETDNNSASIDETQFPEYEAYRIIWKVWPPCILILGAFGNIATIFMMRRIKGHNSSHHVILMALAVSDFLLLYIGALRQWMYHLFYVDVRNLHTVVCKLHFWLVYSTGTVSAWLLSCVTVQRAVAIKWPHKMRMLCTMRRTWIVIAAVVFAACALHFHYLLGMEVSWYNVCSPVSADYHHFSSRVWPWVDMCMSSLLPSVCLLVCNIILSVTLFKAISTVSVAVHATSNADTAHINSRRKTASKTTVMILTLSCSFLLLTLPVCVYLIWVNYEIATIVENPELLSKALLADAVTMLLWYTNSAINFLLYCITGTKFRKEFLSWVRCGIQRHSTESFAETSVYTLSEIKSK